MTDSERDDIVISGISGRFPECENVKEFKEKLFAGIDMVTEDDRRWPCGINGVPRRKGVLNDLSHFDANFFGVHPKQADTMDPQMRILLELTYEALVDAGVNPVKVRGTNTGVFIGVSENVYTGTSDPMVERADEYSLLGYTRNMYANRISYTFDWHGPSTIFDTGCSTGLYAFYNAYEAIKNGKCDAAIVGTANLLINPIYSNHLFKLSMLSPQGTCRTFDETANGFVRSEAAVAVYLQKSNVAKRVYATVLGIDINCDGYKSEGVTFPSGDMQQKLLEKVYKENNISTFEISYIEVHGTGTRVGDPQEVNALDKVFCKCRKDPLLIGSVKSNMGHAEIAAGLCSLVKVLIASENNSLPANLHFKTPNKNIPSIGEGRIKVVDKNEVFPGGFMGVSSMGFGGINAHLVLKPNLKLKSRFTPTMIPRIACVSGCTKEAVNHLLDGILKHKNDDEFLTLVDEVYSSEIKGHSYRGHIILNNNIMRSMSKIETDKRPIWFLYSGMGSQWPGMARDLMKFDTFRASVAKLTDVLRPEGMSLEYIMTNEEECIFADLYNCFLAITGIQIALTDLLSSIGIEPDGIIGHSLGEIGYGMLAFGVK